MAHPVITLAQERSAALVRRDVATIEALLSPEFVYTNAIGAVLGKRDYIKTYVLDPTVIWRSQTMTDVRVSEIGDTAVLVASVHDLARFGERELDADFRTTQVYHYRGDRWQYVAGHTSRIGKA